MFVAIFRQVQAIFLIVFYHYCRLQLPEMNSIEWLNSGLELLQNILFKRKKSLLFQRVGLLTKYVKFELCIFLYFGLDIISVSFLEIRYIIAYPLNYRIHANRTPLLIRTPGLINSNRTPCKNPMTINKTPSRLERHLDQGSYFGSRYRIREQLVKEYMYFTFTAAQPHSRTASI